MIFNSKIYKRIILYIYPVLLVPALENRDAFLLGGGLVSLSQSCLFALTYLADVTTIWGPYKVKDGKMYRVKL